MFVVVNETGAQPAFLEGFFGKNAAMTTVKSRAAVYPTHDAACAALDKLLHELEWSPTLLQCNPRVKQFTIQPFTP